MKPRNRKKRAWRLRWYAAIERRRRLDAARRESSSGGRSLPEVNLPPYRNAIRTLDAPEYFSFVDNTEEMTEFLLLFDAALLKGPNVFLNMARVQRITPDAITLLFGKYRSRANKRTKISGNYPDDSRIRDVFARSGFFRQIARGYSGDAKGKILEYGNVSVIATRAQELVDHAVSVLGCGIVDCVGVYRTLMECMGNTNEHAGERVPWYVSSYADDSAKRMVFTFFDSGLGIFETIDRNALSAWVRRAGLESATPEALMQGLLAGELRSRTRDKTRGKGLPRMKQDVTDGLIEGLTIIANDVKADVANGTVHRTRTKFVGTFLRWSLTRKLDG